MPAGLERMRPPCLICGGEPLMYPQIGEHVAGILKPTGTSISDQRHYIQKRLKEFRPDWRLLFQRAPGRHG